MARFTQPRRQDFYQGENPSFFVTRYKSDLGNHVCGPADIGQATDRGTDPAITAILVTTTGNTALCSLPTPDWWSAQVSGMAFRVEIENNATADLTVDLEFYRAVYGSTFAVESWELIETRQGVADGESAIIIGETARSSIFVRVAGITNPDNDAQLYISARLASEAEIGAGGDSEVGSDVVGVKGWYATTRSWLGLLVDNTGALVVSGWTVTWAALTALLTTISNTCTSIFGDTTAIHTDTTGILADTADIETATETVATAVEDHSAVLSDAAIVKVGGIADAATPAVVAHGDVARVSLTLDQALRIAETRGLNYTNDSVEARETPASGLTSGSTQVSNAAVTMLNGGTSLPCIRATVQNRVGNSPIAIGDSGLAGVNEGQILQAGASLEADIDDVAKLGSYATVLNERLDWIAWTR